MNDTVLSVVIVNWNVRKLLLKAIESVKLSWSRPDSLEIIVVDNASVDKSAEAVRTEHPDVKLIESGANLGFSGGNNVGMKSSKGNYLLLLNPDTEVQADALSALIHYLEQHPDTGMVAPQLLYADGSIQSSKRRFPDLQTLFYDSTWSSKLAPKGLLDHYYATDLADDEIHDVDWVYGAAMLIRREVWETVGGFDESFFMYSEELDWCKRIKDAGWRIVYNPQAKIIHFEGKSSEQVVASRHTNFFTSRVIYAAKYFGLREANTLRLWLLGQFTAQLCLESLKWLAGHRQDIRAKRIKAYQQVLKSRLRPKVK